MFHKSPVLVKSKEFDLTMAPLPLGSGPARFKGHLHPAGDQGFQEGLESEWDTPPSGPMP